MWPIVIWAPFWRACGMNKWNRMWNSFACNTMNFTFVRMVFVFFFCFSLTNLNILIIIYLFTLFSVIHFCSHLSLHLFSMEMNFCINITIATSISNQYNYFATEDCSFLYFSTFLLLWALTCSFMTFINKLYTELVSFLFPSNVYYFQWIFILSARICVRIFKTKQRIFHQNLVGSIF